MVSETLFVTIFVAWYTTSCTGGFIKVEIRHDLRNRKLLDLGSQRRAGFETGIPGGILDSRSEIGFVRFSATAATTAAATINLDVLGTLAQSIDGRNML